MKATSRVIEETIAEGKSKYPWVGKWSNNKDDRFAGRIVMFTGPDKGIVLVKGEKATDFGVVGVHETFIEDFYSPFKGKIEMVFE